MPSGAISTAVLAGSRHGPAVRRGQPPAPGADGTRRTAEGRGTARARWWKPG